MRISFGWLKELANLPWTPEETADKLASLGFPVEKIQRTGVHATGLVVVKILNVEKHPNADRLRLATVTDGKTEKVIVCGAPNIAVGQVVPLATPGAKLPGGVEITISKIRGVESAGMLCSERELGLSEEHAGILQLPAETALGSDVADVLGGQDTILEIEVTPNRPDVLSHIGIARDLAALARVPVRLPEDFLSGGTNDDFPIAIEDTARCHRYLGRVLSNIKVAPSPRWLARRLTDCGIRSINNVVDVTNYVLLEWGHPLHAFDLSRLSGPEIRVRRASKGEKFVALDEKTYELNETDLVIADRSRAVALAGIMGGQDSGVSDATTTILLESAVFERTGIRLTSRRLALRSESSIRFEKGTDSDSALRAWKRAARLLSELAGGKPRASRDVQPTRQTPVNVTLRRKKLNSFLGISVAPETVADILSRLGFEPRATPTEWTCTVPSFRKDVAEEPDLIEEVIRIVGYDTVPTSLSGIRVSRLDEKFRPFPTGRLTETLRGFGINETISNSFCPLELAERFGVAAGDTVKLANPLSKEESALRPALAINLVRAAVHNLNHQREGVALFEIGRVFCPSEEQRLSIVAAGSVVSKSWSEAAASTDIFWVKGLLESVAQSIGSDFTLEPASVQPYLHPTQSFAVRKSGKILGAVGLLDPRVAASLGLAVPCVIAEIELSAFAGAPQRVMQPLSKNPFVERDIAVVVERAVAWGTLRATAEKAAGPLLVSIQPFDLFEGGTLSPEHKSVAFRIRLQDPAKTLAESDITGAVERVKTSLQKACGAQLR